MLSQNGLYKKFRFDSMFHQDGYNEMLLTNFRQQNSSVRGQGRLHAIEVFALL